MEIHRKVFKVNENEYIEEKQSVEFQTFNLKDYIKMFNDLEENNHIEGPFYRDEWRMQCFVVDYPIPISFNISPQYKEFKTPLKAYVIMRVTEGRSADTVYNEVQLIKDAINKTGGFKNLKRLESILDLRIQSYVNKGYDTERCIRSFSNFYKMNNHHEIIKICSNNGNVQKASRALPKFEDIMVFDDIINDYFNNYSTKVTVEFLPIMLWWLITNVLPMRPTEFVSFEKDCLIYSKDSLSPYRIKVTRYKEKRDQPGPSIWHDEIIINEKTYLLIEDSILQLEQIHSESNYLFPVEIQYPFFRSVRRAKLNKRMNRADLTALLKKFYKKVVEEIYERHDLERVKLGDTRHFAIINMALQGFNMLSIARMAGHNEIASQYSYYSHAEHFAQSYVYRLAQKRIENQVSNKMESGIIGWKRYVYDKGKSIETEGLGCIVGKVEYGYCLEDRAVFPSSCIESCQYCSNFAFKPTNIEQTEATKWLADSSEVLQKKIRESIELMRDLSVALSKSIDKENDELLKTTSRSLMSYMDMKAMVDAELTEAKSGEEN